MTVNINYFMNQFQNSVLFAYCREKGAIIDDENLEQSLNNILVFIQSKEQEITILSEDLTKSRCELLKNQKTMKELQ